MKNCLKYYQRFSSWPGPSPPWGEPAFRVKPGDTITTTTIDAGGSDEKGNQITEEMRHKIEGTTLNKSNPLTGPFYIKGSEEGDTLIVEIEKINLNRSTTYSSILPSFASLTEEVPGRSLLLNDPLPRKRYEWKLDLERNLGILKLPSSKIGKVTIPLDPFIGSIGVAPRYGRVEMSLTPGEYGGNMDCVETREGTKLHLPIFTDGGYLVLGDIHAAQGDGELCGVALETTAEVQLKIDLIKDKPIEWPRLIDDEWIMVVGSARPLMQAYKIAHVEMIRWLCDDYGFDKFDALQVLSQVGRCRVGNVVDPNYTVVAKYPRDYLP